MRSTNIQRHVRGYTDENESTRFLKKKQNTSTRLYHFDKNVACLNNMQRVAQLERKQVFCDKSSAEYVLDRMLYNTRPKKNGSKNVLTTSVNKTIAKSRKEPQRKTYTTYTLGDDPKPSHFETNDSYAHLVLMNAITENHFKLEKMTEYPIESASRKNQSTYIAFVQLNPDAVAEKTGSTDTSTEQVLIIRKGLVYGSHLVKNSKPFFLNAKKMFYDSNYINKLYKMYKVVN